jgi:hypothetical protein
VKDAEGAAWEVCSWRCAVEFRAAQGDEAAKAIAGRMFEGVQQ